MMVLMERGNWRTHSKTLRTRKEATKNSTHIWHQARIKPQGFNSERHSALSSLASIKYYQFSFLKGS